MSLQNTSVDMKVSHFTSHRAKSKNLSKFIKVIFVITRISGVFPFKLSSKNTLEGFNGIFFIVLPMSLTCINIRFLVKNFEDFSHEKLFTSIIQVITHINTIVYVFLPFFNKTRIQVGINASIMYIQNGAIKNMSLYPFMLITVVFVTWIFVNLWHPVADNDIIRVLLCVERCILGLLEVQICFLLYFLADQIINIKEEVKNAMEPEDLPYMRHDFNFGLPYRPNLFQITRLENSRRKHLAMYKAMDNLNSAYGLANFMLTMRERFLLAFCLYRWINYGMMFDLILACVNFFKVFLIFYSFQTLKNEERELKRFVKELDSENMLEGKGGQLEHFRKQIRLLNVKFEACGLFSMDMNMIISIVTTTAGYLLLLNQLNL